MASTAEINAAFDTAEAHIRALTSTIIPGFFQGMAQAELTQHRADILVMVKAMLAAAENVRAAGK